MQCKVEFVIYVDEAQTQIINPKNYTIRYISVRKAKTSGYSIAGLFFFFFIVYRKLIYFLNNRSRLWSPSLCSSQVLLTPFSSVSITSLSLIRETDNRLLKH